MLGKQPMGKRPMGATPPDFTNYQRLHIPNSLNIASEFCSQPARSYLAEVVLFSGQEFWVMLRKPDRRGIKGVLENCSNQNDFTVWVIEPERTFWMPDYLKILQAFVCVPTPSRDKVYEAIRSVFIDFAEPRDAAQVFDCADVLMNGYPVSLVLCFLKWLAALEDTRFPPPKYLGRRMAFAGFVLVNSGHYQPEELRRVLKVF